MSAFPEIRLAVLVAEGTKSCFLQAAWLYVYSAWRESICVILCVQKC